MLRQILGEIAAAVYCAGGLTMQVNIKESLEKYNHLEYSLVEISAKKKKGINKLLNNLASNF